MEKFRNYCTQIALLTRGRSTCCDLHFRSKESESQVSKLQSEVTAHQRQIKQMQSELDEQRAKNDVSRMSTFETT
jgi:hypothetical protein